MITSSRPFISIQRPTKEGLRLLGSPAGRGISGVLAYEVDRKLFSELFEGIPVFEMKSNLKIKGEIELRRLTQEERIALLKILSSKDATDLQYITQRWMNIKNDGLLLLNNKVLSAILQVIEIYSTTRFDYVLFFNVPHTPIDFALFCFCRAKKIPFHVMRNVAGLPLTVPCPNGLLTPWALTPSLIKGEVKKGGLEMGFVAIEEAIEMYLRPTAGYVDKVLHSQGIQVEGNSLIFARRRKTFSKSSFSASGIAVKSILKKIRRKVSGGQFSENDDFWTKYDSLSKDLEAIKELSGAGFVYVALHYQPEATTAPLGGMFANQLLMILHLRSVLPANIVIAIKEHPSMLLRDRHDKKIWRPNDFYAILAALPNTYLISKSYRSHDVLAMCRGVATVTGTVGLEALLLGKPVLTFGEAAYNGFPGVTRLGIDLDNVDTDQMLKPVDPQAVVTAINRAFELAFAFPEELHEKFKNLKGYSKRLRWYAAGKILGFSEWKETELKAISESNIAN